MRCGWAFLPSFSWNFPTGLKHFEALKTQSPFQRKIKDSWDGCCWPTVFCQPVVGNEGGKQDVLSQRQKTNRLLFLIRHRLTGWIWISFQPWTEKQVSQKDHLVGLGSAGVYSSLVCPHSFHILHILRSKCAAICRPPFSLCSTDEKKAKHKKEPVKCSRWDLIDNRNTYIARMEC